MDRRRFIHRSSGIVAGGLLLNFTPLRLFGSTLTPGLVKVRSKDYYRATFRAIHELGGIRKIVPPGSSVGFLINSDFEATGAFPKPDIALAMLFLCWEAGAREITMLQPVSENYWRRSGRFAEHRFIIDELKQISKNAFPSEYNDEDFRTLENIEGAVHLKNIEIIRKISEVDVFISIPILKHHPSTLLTGALKNMMGLTTRKTNVTFHLGSGVRNDPEYLAQCIADLNLVRKPDLIVADASEFITGNGPSGPGPLKKLDLVVAGTDPVAIDAFGANCMDLKPEDVMTVQHAFDLGIGEMDLSKLLIVETEV